MPKKVADLSIEEINQRVAILEGWKLIDGIWHNYQYNTQQNYTPLFCQSWFMVGPIIEQEDINLNRAEDGWVASIKRKNSHGHHVGTGDRPTEAAMRCYVASKFGDEVPES